MTASLLSPPPGAARTAWSNPAPVARASHPEPRRDVSSLSPGAHSTGREHVSRLTPGRFLDAALVAVAGSLALFAGAFGAWLGGLPVSHFVMPAGLSCAAASCAAVALSRLSERRSRAAREPS